MKSFVEKSTNLNRNENREKFFELTKEQAMELNMVSSDELKEFQVGYALKKSNVCKIF
jgi:hypothetical protein